MCRQEYKGSQPAACKSFHTLKTGLRADVKRFKEEAAAAVPAGVSASMGDVAAELSAAIDMELAAVRTDQVRLWIQTAMVQTCAADIALTDHRRRCGASSARVWTRRLISWIRACGTACA